MLVICNGMMRSGSTLQYNLAADLLEHAGPLNREGFFGAFSDPSQRAGLEAMRDGAATHILKTHAAPLGLDFYSDAVRVLCSYRDIRDVAASLRKKWDQDFAEIMGTLAGSLKIHADMAQVPGVLMQPYPLLLDDLPTALDQIIAHLGIQVSDQQRTAILDRNAVQAVEKKLSGKSGPVKRLLGRLSGRGSFDQKSLLHPDHISASGGRDGDWATVFSQDEITQIEDLAHQHSYELTAAKAP